MTSVLTSLTIEGFRCFRRFEIPELRRVNLLVGRNNTGKSAILEAAGLFVHGGAPTILEFVSRERVERAEERNPDFELDMSQFFLGRGLSRGGHFCIKGNLDGEAKSVVYRLDRSSKSGGRKRIGAETRERATLVRLERQGWKPSSAVAQLHGVMLRSQEMEAAFNDFQPDTHVIYHIGVARESLRELADSWNLVVGNPQEQILIEALRILEPDLERLVFTAGDLRPDIYGVFRGICTGSARR